MGVDVWTCIKSTIYATTSAFLRGRLTPCALMVNQTRVIFHREGLHVGIVTVFANAVGCPRATLLKVT